MKMKKSSCRKEELECLQRRYEGRGKEGKTRMLDEFCEHYGYARKHAIKLLGDRLPPAADQARPGAEPVYEPVREVIEHIWKASEQLCGKRLEPALELWLPHYGKHYGSLCQRRRSCLKPGARRPWIGCWSRSKRRFRGGCAGPDPARCCARRSRFKVKCGMKGGPVFWKLTAWPI